MSMLYLDNSWPTIAVMRSGLLQFLVSNKVITFHAAICIGLRAFLPVIGLFLLSCFRPRDWMPS